MKPSLILCRALSVAVLLLVTGGIAAADGVTGVVVQPLAPQPGEIITVKGEVLGPNREVEVRIIGAEINIDLGEVQTDAEGDFTAQFRIPDDLAPGNYQVQANGAMTVTTMITVGAAGTGFADTMGQPAPVVRQRPVGESVLLVIIFGVLAAAGIVVAQTAQPRSRPR